MDSGTVFLSYNSEDTEEISSLRRYLIQSGVPVFAYEWDMTPGMRWTSELGDRFESSKAAVICLGGSGVGPVQGSEIIQFLEQSRRRKIAVIPLVLRSCSRVDAVPEYLESRTWIDLRRSQPDPLQRLVDALTEEPSSEDQPNEEARKTPPAPLDHPLQSFPRGPGVFIQDIPDALFPAYANVYAEPSERKHLVARATSLRREADPDSGPNAYLGPGDFPPDVVNGLEFWRRVLVEAGKKGPRMLAAILLVAEPDLFDRGGRRERGRLLERLENWGN